MSADAKKNVKGQEAATTLQYTKEPAKKDENLKHYFRQDLDVACMFKKICDEEADDALFEEITLNLVLKDGLVLKTENKQEVLKCGGFVEFDANNGLYKATADGFVHYHGAELVEVFPLVHVFPEDWKAVLILPPQKGLRTNILVDRVQARLLEIPIKLMVDYDIINDLVAQSLQKNKGGIATIVEGRKPIHGRARKLVLDYDFSTVAGKETSDGKIDFKERKYVNNVDANEIIAHYEDEVIPIDGHSIYNETIKANFETDTGYKLGKNVSLANDNTRIISNLNGIISNADNTISVNNVIEIDSVDLSTGNLEVMGSVIIRENITDGFSVRAKGDIVVYGNVENAILEAEGNVIISGSIVGGRVAINGSLYASFIAHADVTCHGDVIINKYALKSSINSNDRIMCLSKKEKGAIIGGTVSAKNGVFAKTLGGNTGAITDVYVGRDIKLSKKHHDIADKVKEYKDKVKQIKTALGADYLRNPRQFLQKLPPNKLEAVKQTLQEFNFLLQETNKLESERLDIQHELEKLTSAVVSVTENVYSGTYINIGSIRKDVDRNMKAVEFYYSRDYHMLLEKPPTELDPKEYTIEIEKRPPPKKKVDSKTGVFGVNKKK